MDFKDNQVRTRKIELNEFIVRRGEFLYKLIETITSIILITIVFFLSFSILSSQRVSYIIQLPLGYLDLTLVDHLSFYLSVCPIRHPLWLYVSCGSQDNTVQESSPHKCDQKSSCSAFNAMAAAFPQIFLSSQPSCTLEIHAPITRVCWKVTLNLKIHI